MKKFLSVSGFVFGLILVAHVSAADETVTTTDAVLPLEETVVTPAVTTPALDPKQFLSDQFSRGQQKKNLWRNYQLTQKYFANPEEFQKALDKAAEQDLSDKGTEKTKSVVTNEYRNYKSLLRSSLNKTKKENKKEQTIQWQVNQEETLLNPEITDFKSSIQPKSSENKVKKTRKEISKASREVFILKNKKNKGISSAPVKTQKGTDFQYHLSNMKKKISE